MGFKKRSSPVTLDLSVPEVRVLRSFLRYQIEWYESLYNHTTHDDQWDRTDRLTHDVLRRLKEQVDGI